MTGELRRLPGRERLQDRERDRDDQRQESDQLDRRLAGSAAGLLTPATT